jgi:hypothetical protein
LSLHPRYDALQSKAASTAVFDAFVKDLLVSIEPDESVRRVLFAHAETRASSVEEWLKGFRDKADPIVLGALPSGQTAGALLVFCNRLKASAVPAVTTAQNHTAPPPARMHVRFHPGGTTSSADMTEQDKREVLRVQADMLELESDGPAMTRLAKLADLAEEDDETSRTELHDLVDNESDGALLRLITAPVDASGVTVEAEPATVAAVSIVRGTLDSSLERAVFGVGSAQPSDIVIRALRFIRLGRMSKVRLFHLLDVSADSWSSEDPLKAFIEHPNGLAFFCKALQVLQSAWLLVQSKHNGKIIQFITQLQRKVSEAVEAGVSWAHISSFYRALMKRVDRAVTGFAGKHGAAEAPEAKWAKDSTFEWVAALDKCIARAEARKEQREENALFKADIQEMTRQAGINANGKRTQQQQQQQPGQQQQQQQSGGAAKQPKLSRAAKRAAKLAGGQQQQQQPGQQQQQQQQGGGKQQQGQQQPGQQRQPGQQQQQQQQPFTGDPWMDPKKTMDERRKLLTAKMGQQNGKDPCWHHHCNQAKGGCKFGASCFGYH